MKRVVAVAILLVVVGVAALDDSKADDSSSEELEEEQSGAGVGQTRRVLLIGNSGLFGWNQRSAAANSDGTPGEAVRAAIWTALLQRMQRPPVATEQRQTTDPEPIKPAADYGLTLETPAGLYISAPFALWMPLTALLIYILGKMCVDGCKTKPGACHAVIEKV